MAVTWKKDRFPCNDSACLGCKSEWPHKTRKFVLSPKDMPTTVPYSQKFADIMLRSYAMQSKCLGRVTASCTIAMCGIQLY